uniref:Uncharacterized protein n=1 Tax=mine drainage metagenome TaxID=410659 RepID=E6QPA7_9ZZZZ
MKQVIAWIVAVTVCVTPILGLSASFVPLRWQSHHQYTITCPQMLECTVKLHAGEKLNGAYGSNTTQWAINLAYVGEQPHIVPELVVRPASAGLSTNVVITTSQRTYHLYFRSVASNDPNYYHFVFATPAPPPPAPIPTPTPVALGAVPLALACNGDTFRVSAASGSAALWRPTQVCTDGAHTYVQEQITRDARTNVPVVASLDGSSEQLINYTYDASRARFIVDGVYHELALIGGTPSHPWRIYVEHQRDEAALPIGHRSGSNATPTAAPINAPFIVPTPVAHEADAHVMLANAAAPVDPPTPAATPAPRLVPILDTHGRIIAYTIVGGATMPPLTTFHVPAPNGCPQPNPAVHDSGWDSHTKWSRDLRYVTQGANAFIVGNAIRHGGMSLGIFSFLKSPLTFLLAQGVEDYISDRATAHACPRVINTVNTATALSAAINALKAKP